MGRQAPSRRRDLNRSETNIARHAGSETSLATMLLKLGTDLIPSNAN